MPFEDAEDLTQIERQINQIEKRYKRLNFVLPSFIVEYFVESDTIDEFYRHRQETQEKFQTKHERATELTNEIDSQIEQLRAESAESIEPDENLESLYIRLEKAQEAVKELNHGIDWKFLYPQQQQQARSLDNRVSQAKMNINAYEAIGTIIVEFRERYENLREGLEKYNFEEYRATRSGKSIDRPTYMLKSERAELASKVENLSSLLDDGYDEAKNSPLGDRYLDTLDSLKQDLEVAQGFIEEYNTQYVSQERRRHNDIFTDINDEGHDLTDEQIKAIVRDDKYNLVGAGAGSGKTVTLTHRAAYLTRRGDNVLPQNILALTYTGNAADVMESRLENNFGITDVEAKTFHSFGKSIIQRESETRPDIFTDRDRRNFVHKYLRDEPGRNPEFKHVYYQFLKHFYDDLDEIDFKEKEATIESDSAQITLREERVRSPSEKVIADYLFLHEIEYEYESLVEWVENAPGEGQYRATFYLPEYNVVIVHRPVDADANLQSWSQYAEKSELEARIQWERERFDEKDEYALVETYEFEYEEDDPDKLKKALETRLVQLGVVPEELSYDEFIDSAFEYQEYKTEIQNLFDSFIANARQLNLSPDELQDRIKNEPPKAQAFGYCAAMMYEDYVQKLDKEGFMDFPAMIYRAIEYATQNEEYLEQYDQILVDEFQDISKAEVDLLKCFVTPDNDTKLFCVGDDWQSIYSFSGSDVTFFLNFKEYFNEPTQTMLTANYRSPPTVVDAGDSLIKNNERQMDKDTRPQRNIDSDILVYDLPLGPGQTSYTSKLIKQTADLVEQYLDKGTNPDEIMVLSRTNYYYEYLEEECQKRNIKASGKPSDEQNPSDYVRLYSVHQSKGDEATHVIIMHAVEDILGFPIQMSDDELLEPVRIENEDREAEERRLFYVALTRTTETLDIVSSTGHRSRFLDEVENYLTPVKSLRTISGDEDRINLERVSVYDLWQTPDKMEQIGLLSDDFAKCKFKIWADDGQEPLDEDAVYKIERARVSEFNNEVELTLDQETSVQKLETE